MRRGLVGDSNAVAGHSVNVAKFNRSAALTSYSRVAAEDRAAAEKQSATSASRGGVQRTIRSLKVLSARACTQSSITLLRPSAGAARPKTLQELATRGVASAAQLSITMPAHARLVFLMAALERALGFRFASGRCRTRRKSEGVIGKNVPLLSRRMRHAPQGCGRFPTHGRWVNLEACSTSRSRSWPASC